MNTLAPENSASRPGTSVPVAADRTQAQVGAHSAPALVSNPLSLGDAFIVGATSQRIVRFVMHDRQYRKPLTGSFARLAGVIPMSSDQRPRDLIRSLRAAGELPQRAGGSKDRTLVVTGVGDDRKGERLVVLHCLEESALQNLKCTRSPCGAPRDNS